MAAVMLSFVSLASARNWETASSGSPAIARNRLITSSASRGRAPPFSVDCSRKRSAISETERAGSLQRQRQHFRISGGAILPSEGFDPGLQEFAWPAAAIAKHRAEIAEPGRLAGARGGEIIPRHRNGEIRTKAQFLAARVGGQVKAFPDVLTRQVEERLGRLQDRRFGPEVAGLRERQ